MPYFVPGLRLCSCRQAISCWNARSRLERLSSWIETARAGRGATIAVEGEAGIGKSALLAGACERAAPGPAGRDGLANREIAQALFVATRTVEMHLTNAYRKLEISSRDELAGALDGAGAPVVLPRPGRRY